MSGFEELAKHFADVEYKSALPALLRIERNAERSAYRARKEIAAMAVRARRSLGQRVRWAKAGLQVGRKPRPFSLKEAERAFRRIAKAFGRRNAESKI